jgi:Transposase IS116/IS110/IS902 family
VRSTQRLTSTLQNACPQGLQGFPDQDTVIFGDVRSRWPTLQAAHLARRAPRETFLREHHGRSADVIAQRITAIQAALPLTTDAGILPSTGLLVHALVSQLRATVPAMQAFDHAIAQHAQRPPDCAVFQPRPGAGPGFAPRLLVAFGAHRDRYASAAALPQGAGLAPVTERRGKQCWVPWRFQCPPCLRHTCVAWAAEASRHAFWARVYDPQQRDAGQAHQAAVRALAFTWRRLLCRCGQDRTPDEASVSLHARNRRGASLIHNLAQES